MNMVTPKEAVLNAMKFLEDTFPEPISGLRLEEVYPSEDHNHWFVTLSFLVPFERPSLVSAALGAEPRRYKRVTLDRNSGEALEVRAAQTI